MTLSLLDKPTISMAIFNRYVTFPKGRELGAFHCGPPVGSLDGGFLRENPKITWTMTRRRLLWIGDLHIQWLYGILFGWWFGCHFLFSHILGFLIIPIDFHIFQRGWNHQPDCLQSQKQITGIPRFVWVRVGSQSQTGTSGRFVSVRFVGGSVPCGSNGRFVSLRFVSCADQWFWAT